MRQPSRLLAALIVGALAAPAWAGPVPANNSFEVPDLGSDNSSLAV